MGIKDLPKPGINFRATAGAGNFQRKLSDATRYGDLKNLRDNQKAIVGAVKKYQGVIRTKGGLSRLQRRSAWLSIKAGDKKVTKEDRREIKQVLEHLGRGAAVKEKKPIAGLTSIKASDGKSFLTEEQVKKNLSRTMDRDEPRSSARQPYTKQYGGGKVTSYGVRGTMADIGVGTERGEVSFAANYKKNGKLPVNPAAKTPPAAIRPIGL